MQFENPTRANDAGNPRGDDRDEKSSAGKGRIWPWLIVGLLAITVIKYAVVLSTIAADPSIAIQEDYYRRALAWDEHQEARAVSAALGWQVGTALGPGANASAAATGEAPGKLSITIRDGEGRAIAEALVSLRIFHRARAATPFDTTGETDANGRLEVAVANPRRGLWELDLDVAHGDDRFTETRTLIWGAGEAGAGR